LDYPSASTALGYAKVRFGGGEAYDAPTGRPKRPVKYRGGETIWTGVSSKPAWEKLKADALACHFA
jgi:hypothetical protein